MLWLWAKDVELPREENKRQQQNREARHVKPPQYPVSLIIKAYHSMLSSGHITACCPVGQCPPYRMAVYPAGRRQEGRLFLQTNEYSNPIRRFLKPLALLECRLCG